MPAATINPVLHYADLEKAVGYLKETFGFTEVALHRTPDGNPVYAELEFQGCYVGVGQTSPEPTPFDLGPAAFYVAIDDPDTLFARVDATGAEIVMGLTDQDYGSREFAMRDYEGNVWCFGTHRSGPE